MAGPSFTSETELNEWIQHLRLVFSQESILRAAEDGARLAFNRQIMSGVTHDDLAKALLERLRSYTPLNHNDRVYRSNYFANMQTCLHDIAKMQISPILSDQISQEVQIAEVKFVASEALLAINQALSSGVNRSFGDLSVSHLPEYQLFLNKWEQWPDKQQLQCLWRSVQIQNANLGQLKFMLCTEEIFRFYDVRKSYDGSCWKLSGCLHLQYSWTVSYQALSKQDIGDEFEISRRLQQGMDFAEMELKSNIKQLEQLEGIGSDLPYCCPGPSISELRQVVMSNYLPEHLNSLLTRIMTLRMDLGWGNSDFNFFTKNRQPGVQLGS